MGIGDEIMLAGEARRQAEGTARRYTMLDRVGQPRWHFVWEGNPHVARPGETADGKIGYCQGQRPYMEAQSPERYKFKPYVPAPAFIDFGSSRQALVQKAHGCVVFNPLVKYKASPNKSWGKERWERLAALLRGSGVKFMQMLEPGGERITGTEFVTTPHFLDACAVLSGARAAVLQEGGLHHAAAAFGVPALVIRGGFISPKVTGYAGQVDFYVESEEWPLGCGMRQSCPHCQAAMESITPERVADTLMKLLAT